MDRINDWEIERDENGAEFTAEFGPDDFERWGADPSEFDDDLIEQMVENLVYLARAENRKMTQSLEELKDAIYDWVENSVEKISDGVYFLHASGSGWIGAEYRDGRYVGHIEACNAATHAAARDRYAGIVPSESDQDVDLAVAETIIRDVMGEDTYPEMVLVKRAAE